ncbi:hypothetical protein P4475_10995 [Halalkalibacterium halodurans]|uniref:UPF0738 family protein n=1 Tax=Halalkalibacterium halodurans TaxID=86665 RepID=UPI001067714F|nr:hypothetical protein [Halalkalibacterium halodurans]MED3647312.1 hypothetical protein [Halalkalibacterium halodurans]TES54772.1 hypothetical protein E2L07_09090 [Halalkalibacterium halodurans]
MNKGTVAELRLEHNTVVATLEEEVKRELAKQLQATERMLVDSDDHAFVYVLEDEETFFYLRFPEATWTVLKEGMNSGKEVVAHLNQETLITCHNFYNELRYLIDNIAGNGNYGEEMERAVQNAFGE